jgi:hypothetical protein
MPETRSLAAALTATGEVVYQPELEAAGREIESAGGVKSTFTVAWVVEIFPARSVAVKVIVCVPSVVIVVVPPS